MTNKELITALRRNMVETGSLICLGCGHEHMCSTHGCAIMREAASLIKQLTIPQPNEPPTNADRIRSMSDGELAECFARTFCHGYGQTQLLGWLRKPAKEAYAWRGGRRSK